jgi:hypothetical protein
MTMRRRSLLTLAILGLAGCGGGGNGITIVSGTVRAQGADPTGPGVPGVTVVLQSISPQHVFANPILLSFSTTTDANGHFSFRTQPANYRLRALLDGYVFDPAELNFVLGTVDLDGQDFMAKRF